MDYKNQIIEQAQALGFDLIGFAPAQQSSREASLSSYLTQGYHGTMHWLERNPELRSNPSLLFENAKTVITVGRSYFCGHPDPSWWDDPMRGKIARYAWGRDYHKIIPKQLRALGNWMTEAIPGAHQFRCWSDSGPVLEHEQAILSGIGFTGKHTLTLHPEFASLFFLGVLITDLVVPYDIPSPDEGATYDDPSLGKVGCGGCRRCLNVCPTHAFPAPYILNSSKCISYLTIEHQGAIPEALRTNMKNWIFGCDECQEVCPYVKRIQEPSPHAWLRCEKDIAAPRLDELAQLDDEGFLERFKGTPIMRAKRKGLLKNVAIALGNSGQPEAIAALPPLLADPDPTIREHADWALKQLQP